MFIYNFCFNIIWLSIECIPVFFAVRYGIDLWIWLRSVLGIKGVAILATVIVLASALGIVLPWIRLSVVGNLAYETVAAQTALEALGGNLSTEVTDPVQFSAVTWIMTLGISFGIFLLPFVCKRIHKFHVFLVK